MNEIMSKHRIVIVPVVLLAVISIALTLILYSVSGGKEIADDAPKLIRFVRNPLVLWGDYGAAGVSENWGSFPPLFPLFFSLPVYPWLGLLPDFIGFRLGILLWSIVAMIFLYLVMDRVDRLPGKRSALMLFALLPSVWGAIALIPQEEIFVSLFVLALYCFARRGWWRQVVFLLILAVFAGKYFLLVLAVPLALASPRPVGYIVTWCGTCLGLLYLYIAYHQRLHGLSPILGHMIAPGSSLSIWALMWNLGLKISPAFVKIASVFLTAGLALLFNWKVRNRLPLAAIMAGTLYLSLLTISITFPAYVLWAVPIMLVGVAMMERTLHRRIAVIFMFAWGIGEWGANFFRGVALALETDRSAGKSTLADLAGRFLGNDFPYTSGHLVCLSVVIISGLMLLYFLISSPYSWQPVRAS